jgi:general stress protein YciG
MIVQLKKHRFHNDSRRERKSAVHGIRNAPVIRINGGQMTTGKRGFASMDRNRQREIASKGGKLAHLRGMAHEWTSEEAREAGRKGGAAVRQRKPAPDPQRQDQQ